MYYSDPQINWLLQALERTPRRKRRTFFQSVLGCRRRLARKWEETPLAKVFTMPDRFALLKQRSSSARVRAAIEAVGLALWDAFVKFDHSRTGLLRAPELYSMLL